MAAALVALYVIWGSTYLGIRVAIQEIPPFLMAGLRWTIAGGVLLIWARVKGAPRPTLSDVRGAFLLGLLMVAVGNGGVTWGETRIPSGLAALLIASVSLWMVVLEWLRPGGSAPPPLVLVGVAVGLCGVGLLVDPFHGAVDPVAAVGVLGAAVSWALGSILSRSVRSGGSPAQTAGLQMVCGGFLLTAAGLLSGEGSRFVHARPGFASVAALAYLVLFGSLVGYSLYLWLMRTASPALVSTYACVNPAVAVLLGWAFAGESVTARTLTAAAVIVTGVAFVVSSKAARAHSPRPARARHARRETLSSLSTPGNAERRRTA